MSKYLDFNGLKVGRYWYLGNVATYGNWGIGASLIYLNPTKNAILNSQIDTIWNS